MGSFSGGRYSLLWGSFRGRNLELPRAKAIQKKTITTKTQQKAAPNTAAAQTQTAVMVVPGAAGWLVLKDSYFHWFGCLGQPEPVFSSDSNTHRNATHHTKKNRPSLQPTAATAIDGHVAINRSNGHFSQQRPPLAHGVTLALFCSLTRRSYSHSHRSSDDGESGTRARETEVAEELRSTHTETHADHVRRTNPRNPDQRST